MDKAIAPCNTNQCNLALSITVAKAGTNITVTNQQDPVSFQWNILGGNPKVTYVTEDELNIDGGGVSWEAEIIVTDSKGCKVTQTISGK